MARKSFFKAVVVPTLIGWALPFAVIAAGYLVVQMAKYLPPCMLEGGVLCGLVR